MSRAEFLDTNVLVYAYSTDERSQAARELLGRGCVISVQGLNEFANVARRKLNLGWDELSLALADLKTLCALIVPAGLSMHEAGMALARRHRLPIYDSVMIAAALEAGCTTFFSEDLHDGLLIDGRLRLRDPFKG